MTMTPFTAYIVKVIVCSGILYGYYYAALRNNKFHQWNRYYLLVTTLLSLIIPLLQIPLSFRPDNAESTVYTYTTQLVTLRQTVLPDASHRVNYFAWSTWIYLAVIGVLLLRIAYSCWKIMSIARNNPIKYVKPYWFVISEKVMSPFSFFRYIFWNQHTSLESKEGQQILQHELAHLTERHSIDKLALEIITALCWINPFFHLAKREIALIHEFIADKKAAAANGEVADYARTILQMALGTQFTLTNNFFHPPIKRRILMLTQSRQPKFSYLRRIMILPLAAVIFASLSFVVDRSDIAVLKEAITQAALPAEIKPADNKLPVINEVAPVTPEIQAAAIPGVKQKTSAEEQKIEGVVMTKNGKPLPNATILIKGTTKGTLTDENGSFEIETTGEATLSISCVGFIQQNIAFKPGITGVLIQLERDTKVMSEVVVVGYGSNADTVPETPKPGKKNNEIFTMVEQAPQFPGGDKALNMYLNRNIRYPQAAMKANIDGIIFVAFVIDSEGNITDVNTVGKPKGGGLEEEAIRVVKNMPKWKPGIQNGSNVSVQFNIPIRFYLQKDTPKKTTASAKTGPDAIYTFVKTPPVFPGGEKALSKYLSNTIHYPKDAVENGKMGTIFVSFVVRNDGTITDVKRVGPEKGFGLDAEALRVVKNMPKWKPGMQDNQAVNVQFNLPVRFTLQD